MRACGSTLLRSYNVRIQCVADTSTQFYDRGRNLAYVITMHAFYVLVPQLRSYVCWFIGNVLGVRFIFVCASLSVRCSLLVFVFVFDHQNASYDG